MHVPWVLPLCDSIHKVPNSKTKQRLRKYLQYLVTFSYFILFHGVNNSSGTMVGMQLFMEQKSLGKLMNILGYFEINVSEESAKLFHLVLTYLLDHKRLYGDYCH